MFASLISSVLIAASSVSAFDREAWFAKRESLTREATRLRLAYSNCLTRVEHPSENVKIPIETFPDGSVKTFLSASKMMLYLETGLIWADHVAVEQRGEKESVPSRLEASSCAVDRGTKSGWAEGRAKLSHESTTCEGEGIYFSSQENFVSIYRDSRIISKNLNFGDSDPTGKDKKAIKRDAMLLGGGEESLVVTSERSDFDRSEHVVLFDRDVHVAYGAAYSLKADRVFVFLTEANDLEKIEAVGHVSISHEQRSGSCARAVFVRGPNEIEMFGAGDESARLEEVDGNAVEGSRIKFWLDAEQVEVVDSVLTVRTTGKVGLKNL